MKSLSHRFRIVFWSAALVAVALSALSVSREGGHGAIRTDDARTANVATAAANAPSRPDFTPSAASRANPAGCNEALDALSLCTLSKNPVVMPTGEQPGTDGRVLDRMPAEFAAQALGPAPTAPAEAPLPLLPMLAFSLTLAGVLLEAFNFLAVSLKKGRDNAARQLMARSLEFLGYGNGFEIGAVKKSTTAAIAKERLLQYRT